MTIQVIVTGAAGKMGQAAVKAITESKQVQLLGATTAKTGVGCDAGELAGIGNIGCPLGTDLRGLIGGANSKLPTVLVDLTRGESAYQHTVLALDAHIPVVIGATGMTEAQIDDLKQRAETQKTGVLIAPNFSLGAILMMKFAQIAGTYFDWAEIIELHHEKKQDAPSGTAIKTAAMIGLETPDVSSESPARGQRFHGVPIHSVRLPGLLAHQEVIFGGQGQTLTLRHDSTDRSSFMPGMLMAIDKVLELKSLVYGLEYFV